MLAYISMKVLPSIRWALHQLYIPTLRVCIKHVITKKINDRYTKMRPQLAYSVSAKAQVYNWFTQNRVKWNASEESPLNALKSKLNLKTDASCFRSRLANLWPNVFKKLLYREPYHNTRDLALYYLKCEYTNSVYIYTPQ